MFFEMQHFRDALRGIRRSPRYVLLSSACLIVGFGVCVSTLRILERLVLQPPAGMQRPNELKRVFFDREFSPGKHHVGDEISYPLFDGMRQRYSALSQLIAYRDVAVSIGVGKAAMRVNAELVSSNFFQILGASLVKGHAFETSRSGRAVSPEVIISSDVWRTLYGGSQDVIGRSLRVGGISLTIVGVTRDDFAGIDELQTNVWIPLESTADAMVYQKALEMPGAFFFSLVLRDSQGQSRDALQSLLTAAYRETIRPVPNMKSYLTDRVMVAPLRRERGPVQEDTAKVALLLAAMGIPFLLIATANASGLLLLRNFLRERELALRVALGATKGALARVMIWESVIVAAPSALLGALTALLTSSVLVQWIARDRIVVTDYSTFGYAVVGTAVSVFLAFLFQLPLLYRVLRLRASFDLTSRSFNRSLLGPRMRLGIVAGQISLTAILLMEALAAISELQRIRNSDLGFSADSVVVASIDRDFSSSPNAGNDVEVMQKLFRERLETLEQVETSAIATHAPFDEIIGSPVHAVGAGGKPEGEQFARVLAASENYSKVLSLRFREGRWFGPADYGTGGLTAVVNTTLAHKLWGSTSAIGQCVVIADRHCRTVVGVVGDARLEGVLKEPRPTLFITDVVDTAASKQLPRAVLFRTSSLSAMPERIRNAIYSFDPTLPFADVRLLKTSAEEQRRPIVAAGTILLALAAFACVLSLLGIYGSISWMIEARQKETSVRLALGAKPSALQWSMLARYSALVLACIVVGAIADFWVRAKFSNLLSLAGGQSVTNILVAAFVLLAGSIVACAAPVSRLRALRLRDLTA